jgi:outer membrane receptor protein involved in Fe transport
MGLIQTDEVFRPKYYDIYSKITKDITPKDNISAHILYAGDSDVIDRIGENKDIKSKYWNGMLWANWNHLINEKSLCDAYVFAGRAGRDKHEGVDGIDIRSMSYAGLKGDLTYSLGKSQTLKSGVRWQMAQAEYDYFLREDEAITSVNSTPDGWNMNGYLQDEMRIGKWLGGNFGLRFVYQSYGEYSSIMPRLALAVKPSDKLTIRGAYGKYDQPVLVTNLPVEEGISDSHPPEKATHYILSTEYTPHASLLLKTEAYYKIYDDLVGRIKDYGRKEQLFILPKSGTARGVELYARQSPLPRFSWGLGYSLSKSEVDTDNGKIPQNYDRRHSLNLSADYALLVDGWINVVWRYHSGDPYTQAWYEKMNGKRCMARQTLADYQLIKALMCA